LRSRITSTINVFRSISPQIRSLKKFFRCSRAKILRRTDGLDAIAFLWGVQQRSRIMCDILHSIRWDWSRVTQCRPTARLAAGIESKFVTRATTWSLKWRLISRSKSRKTARRDILWVELWVESSTENRIPLAQPSPMIFRLPTILPQLPTSVSGPSWFLVRRAPLASMALCLVATSYESKINSWPTRTTSIAASKPRINSAAAVIRSAAEADCRTRSISF